MPRITRSTPAANASSRSVNWRSPPPSWIGTSTAARICATASRLIGLPCDSAIEIDDVEPLRAGLHPTARGARGIAVVRRLAIEIALDETDATAAPDIDCRIEDHAGTLTSLALAIGRTPSTQPAISFRPAGPLFSG